MSTYLTDKLPREIIQYASVMFLVTNEDAVGFLVKNRHGPQNYGIYRNVAGTVFFTAPKEALLKLQDSEFIDTENLQIFVHEETIT